MTEITPVCDKKTAGTVFKTITGSIGQIPQTIRSSPRDRLPAACQAYVKWNARAGKSGAWRLKAVGFIAPVESDYIAR